MEASKSEEAARQSTFNRRAAARAQHNGYRYLNLASCPASHPSIWSRGSKRSKHINPGNLKSSNEAPSVLRYRIIMVRYYQVVNTGYFIGTTNSEASFQGSKTQTSAGELILVSSWIKLGGASSKLLNQPQLFSQRPSDSHITTDCEGDEATRQARISGTMTTLDRRIQFNLNSAIIMRINNQEKQRTQNLIADRANW